MESKCEGVLHKGVGIGVGKNLVMTNSNLHIISSVAGLSPYLSVQSRVWMGKTSGETRSGLAPDCK